MYKIFNPKTKRYINSESNLGKSILQNTHNCKICPIDNKFLNICDKGLVSKTPINPLLLELQQYLLEKGIQTLIHYPIPPHKQKAYKKFNYLNFPITEKIHKEVLTLPLSAIIDEEDLKYVVDVINLYNA